MCERHGLGFWWSEAVETSASTEPVVHCTIDVLRATSAGDARQAVLDLVGWVEDDEGPFVQLTDALLDELPSRRSSTPTAMGMAGAFDPAARDDRRT
ncbi:MAG TPA: hypothetical protein VGM80_01040 [Gaiellaceae bacterium]